MNIKTIAKLAGVSTATVSSVLNGKYNKASKETIERIQRIVEESGYQPSATARSLINRKSQIIGVVVSHVDAGTAFSVSPYDSEILAYLERYIRNQGYYMMLRCVNNSSEVVPIFSTWNVDGALLLGMFAEDARELQRTLKIPAVFIDTYAENIPIANVGVDDYRGGYLAAKHLLDKGHKRIAFAAPSPAFPGVVRERYRGYCDALREREIEALPECRFETETLYKSGVETGKRIAASPVGFTAVAAMADIIALGVMEGLRLSGRSVPEDVSVVGFDDLPECCHVHPRLTSVSQHIEEKALCAGDYLFSMLKAGQNSTGIRKVDVELVERDSVRELAESIC